MRNFNGLNDALGAAMRRSRIRVPRFTVVAHDLPGREFFQAWRETGRAPIWAGGTDTAVYGDPQVNYTFRAWHDAHHLHTGLGFSVADEVRVAEVQCAALEGLLRRIVWLEIAGQALEFERTGAFLPDQTAWTLVQLRAGRPHCHETRPAGHSQVEE